jgi:hypothetical protein
MLGRFTDAAKTFAGSALTEFSQALDNSDEEGDFADEDAVRPDTPPSLVKTAASGAGVSHEAVEAMREAHHIELSHLRSLLLAVQEEGERQRAELGKDISDLSGKLGAVSETISDLRSTVEMKEAEISHLSMLLERCVADKTKLIMEQADTDVVDAKIFRSLFVQMAGVRGDPEQLGQSLKVMAEVLKLSDDERAEAGLSQDALAESGSLASQFISFLNSDLDNS